MLWVYNALVLLYPARISIWVSYLGPDLTRRGNTQIRAIFSNDSPASTAVQRVRPVPEPAISLLTARRITISVGLVFCA